MSYSLQCYAASLGQILQQIYYDDNTNTGEKGLIMEHKVISLFRTVALKIDISEEDYCIQGCDLDYTEAQAVPLELI